jgi:hypothetical protein
VTRAEALTPEQVAGVVVARERWRQAALSTGRCDRPAVEESVRRAYAAIGLPAPVVVWMDSPVGAELALLAVRLRVYSRRDLAEVPEQLGGSRIGRWLLDQLDQLVAPLLELERRAPDRFTDVLRDRFWSTCAGALAPDLWSSGSSRGDERFLRAWHRVLVVTAGDPPPWDADIALWRRPWGEPWDTAWSRLTERYVALAAPAPLGTRTAHAALVLRAVFGVVGRTLPPHLDAVDDVLHAVGQWWPLRGVSVLSERPVELHADRDGRPHRDDGPAVVHADGFAAHAWHGVRVPADLVSGDGWGPQRILAEHNAELRRCAIERLGWDRFIAAAGMTQVGTDRPDPGNPGQVLRLFELPPQLRRQYAEAARILVVQNASRDRDGSRRVYGLPVPAEVDDPLVAAALTFAVGPDEYAGLQRAT